MYLCTHFKTTVMDSKIIAFEYLAAKFITWYDEVRNAHGDNDLSTLKLLKLLFFCSAVDTTKDDNDTLLDDPFNEFYAMPYGHVESDIYESIRNQELKYIHIDRLKSTFKDDFNIDSIESVLDRKLKSKIDKSFDSLKSKNNELITYSAFDLVELSHKWYSWYYYFDKAKRNGIYSEKIPAPIIKAEDKFFFIK